MTKMRKAQVLANKNPEDSSGLNNGWRRIRTFEGGANRFTVCPFGHSGIHP